MTLLPNYVSTDTLACLAQDCELPQLTDAWNDALVAVKSLNGPPTADQFRRAKVALLESEMLTNIGVSSTSLKERKSKVGLLLLAQLLLEELAKSPAGQLLSTKRFNPVLALAAVITQDYQLTPTIMPAPQWLRDDWPLPSTHPDKLIAIEPDIGSLIFTECEATHADVLRLLMPGSHPVVMAHNALVETLANQPSNHWLTIVIPALRAIDALPTLESICKQSSTRVTVLVISNGPSMPPPALEEMRHRLLSNSESELMFIPALDCGPYDAMNLGIKLANTPWIYFMGADDALHSPEVLAKVHDAVEQVSDNTKVIYGNVEISGSGHGTYDKQIYAYAFDYERLKTQNPCHQAIFYRVDALREIGGYSLAYPVCADWHANLRLWQTSEPKFIDLVVAQFARGGISSNTYDDDFFRDLPLTWEQNKNNLVAQSG